MLDKDKTSDIRISYLPPLMNLIYGSNLSLTWYNKGPAVWLTGPGKIQTRPPTIRLTAGLAKNILLPSLWHVARLHTKTLLQVRWERPRLQLLRVSRLGLRSRGQCNFINPLRKRTARSSTRSWCENSGTVDRFRRFNCSCLCLRS